MRTLIAPFETVSLNIDETESGPTFDVVKAYQPQAEGGGGA